MEVDLSSDSQDDTREPTGGQADLVGGAQLKHGDLGQTQVQFTTKTTFQEFVQQIREDVKNISRSDIISRLNDLVLNQYDYSPDGEKLLDMYLNGDIFDPIVLSLVEAYCPGITQHKEMDRERNVITQLFPGLLHSRFTCTVKLQDLTQNTLLFNVFFNIDRVSKKFQGSRSIPPQFGLRQQFVGIFKDIHTAPTWATKLIHKGMNEKPYIGLYYDDYHILLSDRQVESERDLKKSDAPDLRAQFTHLRFLYKCPKLTLQIGELPVDLYKADILNQDLKGLPRKDIAELLEKEGMEEKVYKALAVLKFKDTVLEEKKSTWS